MARPSIHQPVALRDARQRLIDAAPLIADHPGVEEVHIDLAFSDPEGRERPSPRGMTFEPQMHAFFHFSCPMRDCIGGGFDANAELLPALKRHNDRHTGKTSCQGTRPRSGRKQARCDIELVYTLAIRDKPGAAKVRGKG